MRNLLGQKFGKLTVIELVENPPHIKDKHKYWKCKCECGNYSIVSSGNIGRYVFSCGCGKSESKPRTHGYATHKRYDKLYHTWNNMKFRCYNQKSKDYKYYGARGITVCDEWLHDFVAFREWALSNGYEDGLTIDRIDVNGNYEPSNCRWVTVAEQNKNKTTTKKGMI